MTFYDFPPDYGFPEPPENCDDGLHEFGGKGKCIYCLEPDPDVTELGLGDVPVDEGNYAI